MAIYVYGDPTTTWEIWECGGRAGLFDGECTMTRQRLIDAKWSQIYTFQAAGISVAKPFFEKWLAQQCPPIGSPERVQLYLADLEVEATQ